MKVKSALILGLAATASATQFESPLNNDYQLQQVGKVFTHEYIQPNVDEKCFSVRPLASCDDKHVATHVKHQKTGFHCININNPLAKQFEREANQGQKLPLEHKSQDIQAYVEVPVRCEKIDTEEKRLRKETEKTSEQKIHLIQNQDGEEESFLFEHKPWTTDLENQTEQEQRRSNRRNNQHQRQNQLVNGQNQLGNGQNQFGNGQNFEGYSDDEDSMNEELDTMTQYVDLINKQMPMHQVLKMKDDKFDRLMEHLKFISHSRRNDKWSQQLDNILPNVYSKVAKNVFETTFKNQVNSQQEKEELYQQYKEVAERVYAYVVKQVLQMKQLNQINKISEKRPQYVINQIARNLWYQVQKEMSQKQIQEVREIAQQIQQQKPQLDRLVEETLVGVNKEQYNQMENDFTKVLTAGLKMINHNTQQNQIENEEYKRYHGQDYEQEFQQTFSKLYQRLANIGKNGIQSQTWNN